MKFPVYRPYIPEESVEYARDAVNSTWISSIGKYIDLATERLSEISQCRYVALVNNGTSATHLVARSLSRFRPAVKKILVPSACYVAAYNSLLYDSCDWEIECVDLDKDTWNMDVKDVPEDTAIFAVHNLGNIINVPALAEKYGCTIIEDNCEGLFGTYNGAPSGTKSLCSSMSFFGNKNITSGEGGAVYTDNKEIYDFVLKLRGQGQSNERYIHDEMGYNYRMTNVQAAILLGQLENIDYIYEQKRRVFGRYKENLRDISGIKLQHQEPGTTHSMWMFGARLEGIQSYKEASEYFTTVGIDTRPMFYSFREHPYLDFKGPDEVATLLNNEIVIFPSYPLLTNDEVDYVCDHIIKFLKKIEKNK